MNPLAYGLVAGLAFGVLDVLIMLPMKFDDRATALSAAFAGRFVIGLLVPLVSVSLPMWAIGALVGLLVSVSDAIVTKAYIPILSIGVLGGALIGLVGMWIGVG